MIEHQPTPGDVACVCGSPFLMCLREMLDEARELISTLAASHSATCSCAACNYLRR